MSTLPGQASKGEKNKKFQSLDINSLYKTCRGESSEKQQQKSSSVYIKHGMQSLGKVPSARRAPANLPSLKSEHSGTDAAVALVPPGAPGWGKQDSNSGQTSSSPVASTSQNSSTSTSTVSSATNQTLSTPQMSAHQQAIALPVTNAIPHTHKLPHSAQPAPTDKLWSSVMSGHQEGGPLGAGNQPPHYHSAQFHHEFPSLSSGDGGPTRTGPDSGVAVAPAQGGHGPHPPSSGGLSLRPQTEGSWTQGGQRANTGPPQLPPQVGLQAQQQQQQQQQQCPPQMRGVMPPFMCKGNGFPQGNAPGIQNQSAQIGGSSNRKIADNRPPRLTEEMTTRPIIKDEELSRMDEISRDVGWAESGEIDYNQKLAFSDDESDKPTKKDKLKKEKLQKSEDNERQWSVRNAARGRSSEDDDIWTQRRNQTDKEVEIAVLRAKQRKEEEEKRFQEERKQASNKKLQELEEKLQKRANDNHDGVGTINPNIVPPSPINHVDIPLPEFQKEKEREKEKENRSRTPNESSNEEKTSNQSSFRHLTTIEGKNFQIRRQHNKPMERESRNQGGNYRHFGNDLPPRFKQQQRANNNNLNNQQYQFEQQQQQQQRWNQNGQNRRNEHDADDGKKDYKRQNSEELNQNHHDWKEKERQTDDWDVKRDESIPARPDSRDSRSTRHSRDSEPRDFMTWSESNYEQIEEKRRPAVPGPITKDRIEAEDLKANEKRNLTQLKRGQISDVKSQDTKKDDGSDAKKETTSAWADSVPEPVKEEKKDVQKPAETKKYDDYRSRNYSQNKKGWINDYRSQPWNKRTSGKGKGNIGTDSDASAEDHIEKSEVDGKGMKKSERDKDKFNSDKKHEKKDSSYVPRGEPSRHGRGGGNFRSSRGGLSKRIDVYGPPPAKSPFGHHDSDKEKKVDENNEISSSSSVTEDKTKQNQEALAAGIIGKRADQNNGDKGKNMKTDTRKNGSNNKLRGKDDTSGDTSSENHDDKSKDRKMGKPISSRSTNRSRMMPSKMDKRNNFDNSRQNSSNSINKKEDKDDSNKNEHEESWDPVNGDTEGFQEVKSKKTVKERQKSVEDKQKGSNKSESNRDSSKSDRKPKSATSQLTQQQIQNIPPLMATPVNPPSAMPTKTTSFDRQRQNKLAPRFMKKFKQLQMQQQGSCDVNDINKTCPNVYSQAKDGSGMGQGQQSSVQTGSSAWDKPLGMNQLRNMDEHFVGVSIEPPVKTGDRVQVAATSPNHEKEKQLLDGSTPPVNTLIFENTNYKSTPGSRSRSDKPMTVRSKLEENSIDSSVVMSNFNKSTMNDLLQNKPEAKSDSIQMPLFKEDSADMKLDFFTSDLPFTDEKATKNLCITSKPIHAMTSGNNTVDSLDIKIASVKKVWETNQDVEDNQISFGQPATLDSNVFNQGKDTPDDNHEGYSPSPNQTVSTTTNVCKVKPTQQVSGSGQTVLSSNGHQGHSGIVPPSLMGNPLSPPPPMATVLGPSVGLGPQQFTANQHLSYQTGMSSNTQFGISAIPSPPTVPLVYNSTQQIQAQTASLYAPFQLDQLGGQGRSQYSQYPNFPGLGQTASSPYSTQSVYLQTAPHPPPPTAQAPPELYTNMSNYRLSAAAASGPFGQNQQLNNTVLISSTSNNSLMSPSVKPSSQPISAIGTKAGGVGQAYQQQSQQQQQVYISYDPIQANYLAPSAGVMQRGPGGPVQNNVVPAMQSSSFYSGSTGGQTGFFQQPGSSTMPSAQLQAAQHQANFGLQGNVFSTHTQSHSNTGLQNYNFLTTPMPMAALNPQQFRSATGMPNTAAPAYMKGIGQQMGGDRAQQLKSPGSQEVLSSVFNSVPQIPSPKSRQNAKHPPPQSSPTAQHKYNLYQNVGQQNQNIQRYPTPIQRPINLQVQQNNPVNQKHNNRNNPGGKTPNRQYYSGQNNSLSVQSEKVDDPKLSDNSNLVKPPASDKVKDVAAKEETATLKD